MKTISQEEDNDLINEGTSTKGIGGRHEDYLNYINYYKDDEDEDVIVAQTNEEGNEVQMVGFNAQEYEKKWVESGQPTPEHETYDDRKKDGGFADFETMSNTQRQKSDAMKLGTVKGGKGLIYDKSELEGTENENLKQAIDDLFNALDNELESELEDEEADTSEDEEEDE